MITSRRGWPARWARVGVVSVAVTTLSVPLLAVPAAALQAPVSFTSVGLSTWQTNGVAWTVAAAQGKVFVGGTFTAIRPPGAAVGVGEVAAMNLAVLDAGTGQPDASCVPSFTLPSNPGLATVRSLEVSPDGRTLYVGGFFSTVDGVPAQHLAALDIASCRLVTAFKPLPNGFVHAIEATSSVVYYGGGFTLARGGVRARAAATSAVGTASPGALLAWAPTFDKDVLALVAKPDGSALVAGGRFDVVNGSGSRALVVLDPADGSTLHPFPGFVPDNSVVKDLAVDDTGFYTANEGTGSFDGRIAVDWAGYGQRWRDSCLGATQAVVVYRELLYSGSHAHDCSMMGWFPDGPRQHLLAQSVTDASLQPWFPNTDDGIGEKIGPRHLTVASSASGDYLYAVGEFTTVNGVAQQGITRFGQGPDTAGPTAPTISVSSPLPGQARVSWRQSLDTDDSTLTYQVYRAGSSTPIHTVTGTSWLWERRQLSFVDTGLTAGTTVGYRVTASDGTNTSSSPTRNVTVTSVASGYAERVKADGASFLWRYDEVGDVFVSDATAHNNNGTLRGAATWGHDAPLTDDPSKAVTLSGANTTIYTATRSAPPTTFSTETWFKTTTTVGGKLIGFGDGQTTQSRQHDRHLYMADDGTVVFGVYPGRVVTLRTPRPYNDGLWHHVVATQGTDGMALYLDGTRVASNTTTTAEDYTGYWRVGGDTVAAGWPSRPTSPSFTGSLDETAVYPTALSPSTVSDHYRRATGTSAPTGPRDFYGRTVVGDAPSLYWRFGEPSGTAAADSSGHGVGGRYGAGVVLGGASMVSGTTDSALSLPGDSSGSIATLQSAPAPATFSLETWFRTTTRKGGKIIGYGSSSSGNSATYDRHVYMQDNGRVTFGVRTTDGTRVTISSSSAYNDDRAHHLVAVRGAGGMSLYVDGLQVAANAVTAQPQSYNGFWRVGGDRLRSWANSPSNSWFQGALDEFAVYPVVLSPSIIAAHHNAGSSLGPDVAPPTAPSSVTAALTDTGPVLRWAASLDNAGVTGYEVHRSPSDGFTPSGGTLVGTTERTAFTDAAAPTGVQYYRAVAVDAAGNRSKPSEQVSLVVLDTVAPSAPTGASATVDASLVTLTWAPSSDNVGVADYVVHRSSTAGFSPSHANRVAVATDTSVGDGPLSPGRWFYRIVARDTAGNASPASDEVFADIADTAPPTAPADVVATTSGQVVTVRWSPASDDGIVADYLVHGSLEAGFTPTASSLHGTAPGTSFSDGPLAPGRWYYRVIARDASGNVGPASPEAFVDVAAPPPTVLSVTPVADTYANQGAPSTNFGTSASLLSRGTSGGVSYLRFALPAAPAGKQLVSAVLRIRTTTEATAGSVDSHTVRLADDQWSESSLTWNNRPALNGEPLATLTGTTAVSTVYDTSVNTDRLAALLATQTTLGITSTGTDSLLFWSSNHANTSYRPQLLLSFQ
jgi:fibronectin type 3 domain-containing protein